MRSSRVIASVLLATMISTCSNFTVLAANNSDDAIRDKIVNISGQTRYETAVEVSKEWEKADTVVLVNGYNIVDALPASPYAYENDAPILYTESNKLTPATRNQIKKLKASKVIIIGGTGVISSSVEGELKSMSLTVERIGGNDRIETAVAIANKMGKKDEVAIVNGVNGMADALSMAAAAAVNGIPILLTNESGDSLGAGKEIADSSKMQYIIGGEGVVKYSLENTLPNSERIAGSDRNETNGEVLQQFYGNGEFDNLYLTKDGTKKDSDLVDALTVSPLAAKNEGPVMIVGKSLSPKQEKFLKNVTSEQITTVGDGINKFNVLRVFKILEENRIISNVKPIFPDLDDVEAPTIESVQYGGEDLNKIFINYDEMMRTSGKGSITDKSLYEINVDGQGFKPVSKISGAKISSSIGSRKVTITLPQSVSKTITGSNEKSNSGNLQLKVGKVKNAKGKTLDTSALDKSILVERDGKITINSRQPEVMDSRTIDIYINGEFIGVNRVDLSKIYFDLNNENITSGIIGDSNKPEILTAFTRGVSSDVCKLTIIFKNRVFDDEGKSAVLKGIELKEGAIKTKLGTPCDGIKVDIEEGVAPEKPDLPIGDIETEQIPFKDGVDAAEKANYQTKLKNGLSRFAITSKIPNFTSEPIDIGFGEDEKYKDYTINVDNKIPDFIVEVEGMEKTLGETLGSLTNDQKVIIMKILTGKLTPEDEKNPNLPAMKKILEGLQIEIGKMIEQVNNPIIKTIDDKSKTINLTIISPVCPVQGTIDTKTMMGIIGGIIEKNMSTPDKIMDEVKGSLVKVLNVIGPKDVQKVLGEGVDVSYNNGFTQPKNLGEALDNVNSKQLEVIIGKLKLTPGELEIIKGDKSQISTIIKGKINKLDLKDIITLIKAANNCPPILFCSGATNPIVTEDISTKAEGGIRFTSGTLFQQTITVVVELDGKKEETQVVVPGKSISTSVASVVRKTLNKSDANWTKKYEVKETKNKDVILQAKKSGKTGDNLKVTVK
ncbi:cell wall-binding repeat-containing protein [Clostridium senegalense]|uniref:Cell wall-binding repeat-containing protein n=1 Tax=Clostridium senegalense TaxID=1465809 RepID=A0A6M0H1M5_9CLOT|nr:cell wall-binding repeat-containing protein [Clostridium senegalense]NEU04665.1 cell wall-binding repeat-containing protein [Clostridium senegalense]